MIDVLHDDILVKLDVVYLHVIFLRTNVNDSHIWHVHISKVSKPRDFDGGRHNTAEETSVNFQSDTITQ